MSRKVKAYVIGSWILLITSLVAWPVTQLTVAKDEPPFVLGLSWMAIVLTCLGVVVTADVRKNQDDDE
jgi:hypothetical protein